MLQAGKSDFLLLTCEIRSVLSRKDVDSAGKASQIGSILIKGIKGQGPNSVRRQFHIHTLPYVSFVHRSIDSAARVFGSHHFIGICGVKYNRSEIARRQPATTSRPCASAV